MTPASEAFLPDPRRAGALAKALQVRLADSLDHLRDACRSHVALDEAAIDRLIADILRAPRLRPDLFILHRDIVGAIHRDDLASVSAAFARICAAPVAAAPDLACRAWGDGSFSDAELRRYTWAFGEDGDTPITLTAPDPAACAQARDSLARARALLRAMLPDLHDEIDTLVVEVILAAGNTGPGMTFDGVTAFHAHGAIVLNAAEHRSLPGAVAGLVHEAAHVLLFAESQGAPLVANAPDERYPSPLRPDPRPMNGIYHATFVSARMAYALEALLTAESLSQAEHAEMARLAKAARQAFAAGHAVLTEHANPTPQGAALMRAAARQMAA